MLKQVADGVLVHESAWLRSNAVIVQGEDGVLLIDAGITAEEMTTVADALRRSGRPVVAAFSTHPHWDHLLWHRSLGDAPRYGTAACAARIQTFLSDPQWRERIAGLLPPDVDVPLDLLGRITGLPTGTTHVPWHGPRVRIVEHQAHATGHAALLLEDSRVLVAGDMLSDAAIPMLDGMADDPVGDHLAALQLLEGLAEMVDVVVPGHGSVGGAGQLQARIDRDRAYVLALRDGRASSDPRLGASAEPGWEWVNGVHEGQLQRLGASTAEPA